MVLHKLTKITESKTLELRFEAFNAFNHAQFCPNGSVDGDISDATFGHVLKAALPRIGQVALKFTFLPLRERKVSGGAIIKHPCRWRL
jgi:hypothetical protein